MPINPRKELYQQLISLCATKIIIFSLKNTLAFGGLRLLDPLSGLCPWTLLRTFTQPPIIESLLFAYFASCGPMCVCMYEFAHIRVCVCVRARARACMRIRVRRCFSLHALAYMSAYVRACLNVY